MTGNRTGAGHSAGIPIAPYSHRKAIDQDMTGAVCFRVSVLFRLENSLCSHYASGNDIAVSSRSQQADCFKTHTSDKQQDRKYPLMNYYQQVRVTYQQREWGVITDRGFSGLRWERAPLNSYCFAWLLSVKQRDAWIFALSCGCQRGQAWGRRQNVSLSGVSTRLLGYHQ